VSRRLPTAVEVGEGSLELLARGRSGGRLHWRSPSPCGCSCKRQTICHPSPWLEFASMLWEASRLASEVGAGSEIGALNILGLDDIVSMISCDQPAFTSKSEM
jgi:hypothetical protein